MWCRKFAPTTSFHSRNRPDAVRRKYKPLSIRAGVSRRGRAAHGEHSARFSELWLRDCLEGVAARCRPVLLELLAQFIEIGGALLPNRENGHLSRTNNGRIELLVTVTD